MKEIATLLQVAYLYGFFIGLVVFVTAPFVLLENAVMIIESVMCLLTELSLLKKDEQIEERRRIE